MEGQNGLTPAEFAAKIKEKYPQYKDVEDSILVEKMLAKYPEYKDKLVAESTPEVPKGEVAGVSGDSVSPSADTNSSLEYGQPEKLSEKDSAGVNAFIDRQNTVPDVSITEATNPELYNEKRKLEAEIASKPVMSDNSKEQAKLDELNASIERMSAPQKSNRKLNNEKIADLNAQQDELTTKAVELSKNNNFSVEEILNSDGTYQDIIKQKAKYKEDNLLDEELLNKVKVDTNSDQSGFFGKVAKTFGLGNEEVTQTVKLNDAIEEQILLDLQGDNRTKEKIAKGYSSLNEKESIITNAKVKVVKAESLKILEEAKAAKETITDKSQLDRELKNLDAKYSALLGEVGYDVATGIMKNNFRKTDESQAFDEMVSSDGFFHETTDAISTLLEGVVQTAFKGTIGFTADVMAGLSDVAMDDNKYSVFDAFSDTVSSIGNYNLLPSSKAANTRIVDDSGDLNVTWKTVTKSLAQTLPFTLAIINDAKRGGVTNIEVAMGKLLSGTRSASMQNSLRLIDSAYRHTLSDNIVQARELGLTDNQGRAYAHTMSMVEGVAELIMPDTKFFSTEAGNVLLTNFKKDLKTAATKQAAAQVSKNFIKNIILELGEEEVVLAAQDLMGYAMVVGHENSDFFDLKQQKELAAATIIMSGTLGGLNVKRDFKGNIIDLYKNVSENINGITESLRAELELGMYSAEAKAEITNAIDWANKMNYAVVNAPAGVTGEQIDLLMEKADILTEMKSLDPAFHAQYKEKIAVIDAKINPLNAKTEEVITKVKSDIAATKAKESKKKAYKSTEVSETTDAKQFVDAQSTAMASRTTDKMQVDILTEKEAQGILDEGGKLFMTNDGKAGAYVKADGYMGGLFKDPTANRTEAAKALQEARVKAGGKFFDAYGTHLEDIYVENGFRPIARMDFDEKLAGKGWEKTNLKNKPDNVFFVYDPTYKASKGEGVKVKSYNEGYVMANNFEARTGKQNTEFFTGKAAEASSKIPYEPVLEVDETTPVAKAYNVFSAGGNFTGHISKMIAGFAEKQVRVAEAIVKGGFKNFLDIGTSEGGMIKTVASQSNTKAVGIDPNSQMKKNFESTPAVEGAEFRQEAFKASWVDDDGTVINEFKPTEKFDVVNEDFAFQFMNNDRASQVKAVKEMMTDDGVFVTSEKFHTANQEANEKKKYDHQRKYFDASQLTEDKQTIVSGMADDMVNDVAYYNTLKENFKYVEEFWNAGNFKGYLASDSKEKLDQMKENIGDLSSEFTDPTSQTSTVNVSEVNQLLGEIDSFMAETGEVLNDQQAVVLNNVKNARTAISKVAPNVEIKVYNTTAEYVEATGEQGSSGNWNPNTNTISINLETANARTVAHETVHAILGTKITSDAKLQEITDKFVEVLNKNVDSDVAAELSNFTGKYKEGVRSEEAIAELAGMLSANYTKLNNKAQSLVKQWLDSIAKKLGLKTFTDNEVIDLLNTLAVKAYRGEAITEKDLRLLGRVDSSKKGTREVKKQIAESLDTKSYNKASSVAMFADPNVLKPVRQENGRTSVLELGRSLDKRAKDLGYYIPLPVRGGKYTEAQLNQIAEAMTDDAQLQLLKDDSGIGWYDTKTKSALELMSRIHSELKDTNSEAHLRFTLLVAFISQNNTVSINFRQANEAYTQFKETGDISNRSYAGKSGNIIKENIRLAFEAIDNLGWKKFKEVLNSVKTVKDWENLGYSSSGENKTTRTTGAMVIMGSKIGSFWGNLNGDFSTLTADLWFSRMFNRYTGNVVSKKNSENSKNTTLSTLKSYRGKELLYGFNKVDLLKGGKLFDEWVNVITAEYAKGGYKDKQPLNITANTHYKNVKGELQDVPRGGNERVAMREVVQKVQDNLVKRGYPRLDIADIQAIVWYNEKDLYGEYKAVNKSSEKTDYETAAQEVLRGQGVNADVALQFQRGESTTDGRRDNIVKEESKKPSETREVKLSKETEGEKKSIKEIVKFARSKGYSDEVIKVALTRKGFTAEEIRGAVVPAKNVAAKIDKGAKARIRTTTGQVDTTEKVTTTGAKLLKERFRNLARGAKIGAVEMKRLKATFIKEISIELKSLTKSNIMSLAEANRIMAAVSQLSYTNYDKVSVLVDKVIEAIENKGVIRQIKANKASLRKSAKSSRNPVNMRDVAKQAIKVNERYLTPERRVAYNELLNQIRDGFRLATSKKYSMPNEAGLITALEVLNRESEKARLEILAENLGVDGVGLTKAELVSLIEAVDVDAYINNLSEAKQKEARLALEKQAEYAAMALNDIDGTNLSEQERKDIKTLKKADLTLLSATDIRDLIKIIDNIATNDSFASSGEIISKIRAYEASKEAMNNFNKDEVNMIRKSVITDLKSVALIFKKVFMSAKKSAAFNRLSGLNKLSMSFTRHKKAMNKLADDYNDLFSAIKKKNSSIVKPEHTIFRGIVGQLIQGSTAEDFEINRSRVEDHIAQIKKNQSQGLRESADKLQLEFDKVKDLKSQDEVIQYAKDLNDGNWEILDFWLKHFESQKDALKYNTEVVHGKSFEEVSANYLPIKMKGDINFSEDVDNAAFFSVNGLPAVNPSPTTISRTKSKKLPRGRVLDLDFDSVMFNKASSVSIDIETSTDYKDVFNFFRSPNMEQMFGRETLDVFNKKVNEMRKVQLGISNMAVSEDEITKNVTKIERIWKSVGTSIALGGLTQYPKQYVSVVTNIIPNLGKHGGLMFKAMFTDKSNMPILDMVSISLRGETQAGTVTASTRITEAEKHASKALVGRIVQQTGLAADKIRMGLFYSLRKGDVNVAKSSWVAFYTASLLDQGVDSKDIDMSTEHERIDDVKRQQAISYAELKVEETQISSDESRGSEFYQSKEAYKAILRSMFLPFQSFNINSKMRMLNDLNIMSSKRATSEQKMEAGRSFIGTVSEIVTFTTMKYFILSPLIGLGKSAIMDLFGLDAPDDDEEKKKEFKFKQWYSALAKDLNPLTIGAFAEDMNIEVLNYLQYLQDADSDEEYLDYIRRKQDDGGQLFYRYKDKEERGKGFGASLLNGGGLYAIPMSQFGEASEVFDLATKGTKRDDYGNLNEYDFSDNEQMFLKVAFAIELTSMFGLGEADTRRMMTSIRRDLVKNTKKSKVN